MKESTDVHVRTNTGEISDERSRTTDIKPHSYTHLLQTVETTVSMQSRPIITDIDI